MKHITAASTRLKKSVARGVRKPSAHNTYADWRGDGNTRKRRKQTEVPPCVRSPLLPCALFSRCENVTSEWGTGEKKSFPPAACQLNHVQIFTQWSRRGAHTIPFFPLVNAWGVEKKNKQTKIAIDLNRRPVFADDAVDTKDKNLWRIWKKELVCGRLLTKYNPFSID